MKQRCITVLMLALTALYGMANDTLTISNIEYEKELPGGSSRVIVQFPTSLDNHVRRAVIDYILECCQSFNAGVELTQPSNTCDESEFKKYLEAYTSQLCLLCAEDQHDYAQTFDEDGNTYQVQWFANLFIAKTAETDFYVSYAFYHGEFAGGAHDERGSSAITIRKSDGTRVSDIFVEDAEDDMQPLLWKYLIASEQPEDEKAYVADINQFLKANYGITDYLHLPYGSIYLAPDGVHILYNPLEICFWPGEPEVVIPLDAAKPFLTTEAKELIQGLQ